MAWENNKYKKKPKKKNEPMVCCDCIHDMFHYNKFELYPGTDNAYYILICDNCLKKRKKKPKKGKKRGD